MLRVGSFATSRTRHAAVRRLLSSDLPPSRLEAIRAAPTLAGFMQQQAAAAVEVTKTVGGSKDGHKHSHKPFVPPTDVPKSDTSLGFFIETYGCQMNVSDSEIVRSMLLSAGHHPVATMEEADVILTNTCAVRDNAEAKVWHRLKFFQSLRRKNAITASQQAKEAKRRKQKAIPEDIAASAAAFSSSYDGHLSMSEAQNLDATPEEVASMRSRPPARTEKDSNPVTTGAIRKSKLPKPQFPLVGVLGCMAERLKERLLVDEAVDFICGPDAYRDIPRLLHEVVSTTGQKAANTVLSFEETYADVSPVREVDGASAFVSIMRGCNNMCAFCIVPFTRGRERSRPFKSVLREIEELINRGVKEIVLLGQNVNGFHDTDDESLTFIKNELDFSIDELLLSETYRASPGFKNMYQSKKKDRTGVRFADLLQILAVKFPEVRFRFTSPHPKDFPEEVFQVIGRHPNLAKSLHMPLQSGSTSCLDRMRRGYDKEAYLSLIKQAKSMLPGVCISTDVIAGFCGETEEEHLDTVAVMAEAEFDQAFMFAYSLREKTHAARVMKDDVPADIKNRRLQEIIATYREKLLAKNAVEEFGRLHLVLVEGKSTNAVKAEKRGEDSAIVTYTGRTDGNKRIVFPANPILPIDVESVVAEHSSLSGSQVEDPRKWSLSQLLTTPISEISDEAREVLLNHGWTGAEENGLPSEDIIGDFAIVRVLKSNSTTLHGVMLAKASIPQFASLMSSIPQPVLPTAQQ